MERRSNKTTPRDAPSLNTFISETITFNENFIIINAISKKKKMYMILIQRVNS